MKKDKSVLIIGGDKRQKFLFKLLSEDGYNVTHLNENSDNLYDLINSNDIIFLPLPVSKDRVHIYSDADNFRLKLADAVKSIKNISMVFGGGIPKEVRDYFEDESIEYHDCLISELFELQNAYFTAQGALKLLLDNTEDYLLGKTALIIGFGRIATALSEMLKNLNMKVTVAARNELQLKTAKLSGFQIINLKELRNLSGFDFVFNTVPYRIFDEAAMSSAGKNSVYFELASAPFGVDKELAQKHDIRYVQGGALPGKYLPLSSAKLLKEYMEQFI